MIVKVTLNDKIEKIHGQNTLEGEVYHFSTAFIHKRKRDVCLWLKNIKGLDKDQLAQIPMSWVTNIEHVSPTLPEITQ